MAYFSFFYNIIITSTYIINIVLYLVWYIKKREKSLLFISIMFFLFVMDNLLLYMNEQIPSFSIYYHMVLLNKPYLATMLGFSILMVYRMIFIYSEKKSIKTKEAVFWILLLIIYFITTSLYPNYYARLTMLSIRRIMSISVFAIALRHSLRFQFSKKSICFPLFSKKFLTISLILQILASIEFFLPYIGLHEIINERNLAIELIGIYFSVMALVFALKEINKHEFKNNNMGLVLESYIDEFCSTYSLTNREIQVLGLLVTGKTNAQISEELFVSEGTIKTHTHNIYNKLNISNRFQLQNLLTQYTKK